MQADSNSRPSVAIAALGCKLSQAEGDAMAELLLEAGFCLKPFSDTITDSACLFGYFFSEGKIFTL